MSIKSNNQTNRWHQAVYNLYPAAKSIDEQGNPFDTNSNPVAIDEAAVGVETERLDAIRAATRYQVDRAYPAIGDQLDMIYHDQVNGTTTFKDAIKAVKDANPKP